MKRPGEGAGSIAHLTYGVAPPFRAFCSNSTSGSFDRSEQVSVIQCYCPTCRRTVYAEDTDSPECPVCLTRVFVAADDSVEQPGLTR